MCYPPRSNKSNKNIVLFNKARYFFKPITIILKVVIHLVVVGLLEQASLEKLEKG